MGGESALPLHMNLGDVYMSQDTRVRGPFTHRF
jgi:hypothetical protein